MRAHRIPESATEPTDLKARMNVCDLLESAIRGLIAGDADNLEALLPLAASAQAPHAQRERESARKRLQTFQQLIGYTANNLRLVDRLRAAAAEPMTRNVYGSSVWRGRHGGSLWER